MLQFVAIVVLKEMDILPDILKMDLFAGVIIISGLFQVNTGYAHIVAKQDKSIL
jgi:hypothetical protein